ncbi:hypothetical protein [Marinobacter sp. OP 3.4]
MWHIASIQITVSSLQDSINALIALDFAKNAALARQLKHWPANLKPA